MSTAGKAFPSPPGLDCMNVPAHTHTRSREHHSPTPGWTLGKVVDGKHRLKMQESLLLLH